MGACLSGSVPGPTFMSEQGTQNQAMEQNRDSVQRSLESFAAICSSRSFAVHSKAGELT